MLICYVLFLSHLVRGNTLECNRLQVQSPVGRILTPQLITHTKIIFNELKKTLALEQGALNSAVRGHGG